MSLIMFPEPRWFIHCFSQADSPVPDSLQSFAKSICCRYLLSRPCDPIEVANALALALALGDGKGNFYPCCKPGQAAPTRELAAKFLAKQLAPRIFTAPQMPCYLEVFKVLAKALQELEAAMPARDRTPA